MHSWAAQASEGHSINGCRQTVRVCKVKWNLLCTLVSGQQSLSAVRGRENIPAHTAVTCLHCYILLYIESFSQLAPKNKHSLVCRWTRQTGRHGRRRQTLKPGAHSKTVPSQPGPVTFRGRCLPFQWVTACSADLGCHSLYATLLLAWPCELRSSSNSPHL